MITCHSLGSYGRLGNQLFQYSALRSLGLEKKYEIAIPNPDDMIWDGQKCLLNNFNIPKNFIKPLVNIKYHYVEPDAFKYDPNFFNIPDNTTITGFFQSTLYFKKYNEIIKKELTPKKEYMDEGLFFINSIRNNTKSPIVSIHLRRGDITDGTNPDEKTNKMYEKNGEYFSYLKKALSLFSDCTFLIFTGGKKSTIEDNSEDIEWCKKNLGFNAIYSQGTTMQDFCRIMHCDHNILSPASSFGWWAAYLGYKDNKKIVAPNKYHPDLENYTHRENFYPEEFLVL